MAADNLEELLCKYDGQAFTVALNMLRDSRSDAEDALQEARIACWQSIGNYDARRGGFCEWYMGIVRKCCQQLYKRRQRSADWVSLGDVDEIIASPLDQLIDRDERSYLHGAVDVLPPEQSQVVRMRYLEGMEYPDIATAIGAPEATVRSNVRHGLNNLKERIGNVGAIGA